VSAVKREIIKYRMANAHEALDDARFNLEHGRLKVASNRIYYAMFYANIALLATRDISSSRHSGAISLLHEHFVRTGEFPRDLAGELALAFEMRNDTDYEDHVEPDSQALQQMLARAQEFIDRVEALIPKILGRP